MTPDWSEVAGWVAPSSAAVAAAVAAAASWSLPAAVPMSVAVLPDRPAGRSAGAATAATADPTPPAGPAVLAGVDSRPMAKATPAVATKAATMSAVSAVRERGRGLLEGDPFWVARVNGGADAGDDGTAG